MNYFCYLLYQHEGFLGFLHFLGLKDKYPQKITLNEALSIGQESLKCLDKVEQLPHFILQNIMMRNANSKKLCKMMSLKNPTVKINSMDSLIALLHCCDDFLRQELLSRLAACQQAIPVLLPDQHKKVITFLLWSMRLIVLEWKCKYTTTTVSKTSRIVNYKGPIISFLRIGASHGKMSKSHILNTVIGDQKYFFSLELRWWWV